MAKYEVELPDGRKYELEGDHFPTEDELLNLFGTAETSDNPTLSEISPESREQINQNLADYENKQNSGVLNNFINFTQTNPATRSALLAMQGVTNAVTDIRNLLPGENQERANVIQANTPLERAIEKGADYGYTGGLLATAGNALGATGLLGQGVKIPSKIARAVLMDTPGGGVAAGTGGGALEGALDIDEDNYLGQIAANIIGGLGGVGAKKMAEGILKRLSSTAKSATTQAGYDTLGNIPLTKGQATGNVADIAFETDAKANTKGAGAYEALKRFGDTQETAVRNELAALGGKQGEAEEFIDQAINKISGDYNETRQQVNDLYNTARALSKESPATVQKGSVTGLYKRIVDKLDELGYNPQFQRVDKIDLPNRYLQDISEIVNTPEKATIQNLEDWRRGLTTVANANSTEPSVKTYLNSILRQYDDWLNNLDIKELAANANPETVDAFVRARLLRSKQGKLFESNKTLKDILTNEDLTAEQVAQKILGDKKAGAGAGNVVKTLINSQESQEGKNFIREQLRNGLISRAFTNSVDDTTNNLSYLKLARQLQEITKNKTLTEQVFKPDERRTLNLLLNALQKINYRPDGTINPSGTAYKLLQSASDLSEHIPVVGTFVKSFRETLRDSRNSKRALQNITLPANFNNLGSNIFRFVTLPAFRVTENSVNEKNN